MIKDTYGEILNSADTYREIAYACLYQKSVLIGWTDEQMTHLDILFTYKPTFEGANHQGGIKPTDLFVSVMRRGAFGFERAETSTHSGYINEKLGGGLGSTAEKLAELINGVRNALLQVEKSKP